MEASVSLIAALLAVIGAALIFLRRIGGALQAESIEALGEQAMPPWFCGGCMRIVPAPAKPRQILCDECEEWMRQ